ncbi:hypothetical protein [Actinoplanes awajinensis]|uniref:Glycosyltransferase 2-like domain-containing protein n=1 Tax=Actinoplanes awajinensis subsp. mycoplanecinus TaxID=135947 RepID=A0A0X3V2J6_9ACTN|nr:hypothetical protein [Actinoplanes awajinensis]KUL38993.1 hypothetical protein ADL15_10365 [Actinoplanes awajinensis subsp. mycoplanecinus]
MSPGSLVDARELHHGSHAGLLQDEELPTGAPAGLDAIIVPTAWPVDALRHVMQVGNAIGCPVVALCSRDASAERARKLAEHEEAAVLAVDVDQPLARKLPAFATDRRLREAGFGSTSDLSLKRNLGLVLARGSGWQRVLFLDDDIHIDDPQHLHRAAGLVDDYRAVGLANHGYADNSVVCHAYREVGGAQSTFIGGGAMIVDTFRTRSFYPNIYNEDWFFLLGDGIPFRAARAGAMRQRTYDPFANPGRAAAEELGDTLAEGLFWLLETGSPDAVAESAYWGDALYRRRRFIDLVIDLVGDGPEGERMRRALVAARGRSAAITHRLCQSFVELWQADLARWRAYLDEVPVSSSPEKFLHEVAMTDHVHTSTAFRDR